MKKLYQKEILDEGFGSMMKSLARGAAGLAKGTAKMISPTAARVAKDAADKVGAAIGNVLSSPTAAVKDYFNRPRPNELAGEYGIKLHPVTRTDANSAAYPSGHTMDFLVMIYQLMKGEQLQVVL